MEFSELVRSRYSVRAYQSKEVEESKLNAVLEAARLAPTACNLQPFRIIVIHTAGKREELSRIYRGKWFADAPIVICVCTLPKEAWSRPDKSYADVDALLLWITSFSPPQMRGWEPAG